MAIAFVGAWTGIQFNSSAGGSTATRTVTTGNFLGIATSGDQATIGTTSTTPADTVSLANAATRNSAPGDYIRLQYVAATTGSATYTVNIATTAGSFSAICAAEWSGLTATPLDQASITGTGNSGTLLSTSVTTTQADELLLGHGTIVAATDVVWTAGASYTIRSQTNIDSTGSCTFLEERIVTSTSGYTAGATKGAGSGIWICGIATFKAASTAVSETGLNLRTLEPPGRRAPNTMRVTRVVRPGSGGAAGQTFNITPSGSVTAAGALAKQTAKPFAGSSTPSGALARFVAKALAGSSTAAGAIGKLTAKAFAGSSTAAGAVAKQTAKPLAGSSTASGALAKLVGKAFAGSTTASGALSTIKVVLRSFSGSVTASGALVKQVAKAVAGSSTPAGALSKQNAKALAGVVTPSGALAKLAKKVYAGSVTASGALTTMRVILRSFGGSVTPTGALARQAQKTLTGSSTPSGTVKRSTAKGLVGVVTAVGAVGKLVKKAYAGALTAVGTFSTSTGGGGPYAMATISQDAGGIDLEWREGDPVSMAIVVQSVDWSGTYTAQIRAVPGLTQPLVGTLTAVATYSAPNTSFLLTMSAVNSALILAGSYVWDLQQTAGPTRLAGRVTVKGQVTQ